MNKAHFSLAGAAAALAIALPAVAQEYSWDMPNTFGRNSSDGVADLVFAELLTEKSGGRIKITHHFDGSLGYRGVDLLAAVQDGAVPIARHANAYYGGFDPVFLFPTLPFLIRDIEDVETMYQIYKPYVEAAYASYDQVVVSTGLFPPSGIWSKEPVSDLSGLQGLKIRAFDLNSLETFSGAGASAVNMNWGDVLPALSTGAIEGVVTSADLGNSANINEYLPNFTEINWAVPLSAVTIGKDTWDALPDDLKAAVMEAGEEARKRTFDRLREQVAKNYIDMRAKGANVIQSPAPDLVAALSTAAGPVIARWRETAGERAALMDEYLAAVGR